MASRPSRPLPTPPGPVNPPGGWDHDHICSLAYPYRTATSVKFAPPAVSLPSPGPVSSKKEGELVETWCPNLGVLCTFTITTYPYLLT